MKLIEIKNLIHKFTKYDSDGNECGTLSAIDDVTFSIEKGEFIAVLGHNGSGKSTLAKHLNALLTPTEGTVFISGMDAADENNWIPIRKKAGMVFQNPDNQIISNVVEEDVAFGPENLGISSEEIMKRVEDSLEKVGMTAYRYHSPNKLSGGQKQRVAIAGVLAMQPDCIVLDEPTAMLDPHGRMDVIDAIVELNKKLHITVVLITHYMEETIYADRVVVMDHGKIMLTGTPREIFCETEKIRQCRLMPAQVTELSDLLAERGLKLKEGILTREEFIEEFDHLYHERKGQEQSGLEDEIKPAHAEHGSRKIENGKVLLELSDVDFVYGKDTPFEKHALNHVNFCVRKGDFIGLAGHTGSGKSTLVQLLNALEKPQTGNVLYLGENVWEKDYDRRALRGKVGLVFQYPEHQLFEITVYKDICYGPKNLGLSEEEIKERAEQAMKLTGITEEMQSQSPFQLSGGQKRRAAIAGILAMKPEILVLDEPTAGLDPVGRIEILDLLKELHEKEGLTVVLVSHSMEDLAKYATRLVVMDHGEKIFDDTPRKIFSEKREILEKMGLDIPEAMKIVKGLSDKGYPCKTDAITVEEAADDIMEMFAKKALKGGVNG